MREVSDQRTESSVLQVLEMQPDAQSVGGADVFALYFAQLEHGELSLLCVLAFLDMLA